MTATLTYPPVSQAAARPGHVRLDAGPADIAALNQMVGDGARAGNEHPSDADRLDHVIPKPWGQELRAFADDYYDVWTLAIGPGHATSMHVHPRKLTYLVCLDGEGVTASLEREVQVGLGTIIRIAPGAFHSTRNSGAEPLCLVEVEAPRNKLDLLRLSDGYSRQGTAYETDSLPADDLPLRGVRHRPNTRMRDRTPDRRYAFGLRTGMDLFYRRGLPADLFYVPLCMSGLTSGDVQILAAASREVPDTARTYLCISRAS